MTKRKSIFTVLMCVVLSVVMLFTMASCETKPKEPEKTEAELRLEQAPVESFKQLSVGDTIYVVPTDEKISVTKSGKKLQTEELILVTSLQGIVAQTKAQIYIGEMDDDWVTYLTENYGLKFEKINSLEELLDKFAGETNKTYVKFTYYESNVSVSNINAATTIASATKSVMLPMNPDNDSAALQSLLESKGFTALDVGMNLEENTMGDATAVEKYKDKLSKDTVAVLNPMMKTSYQVRDYAIAMGAGVVMADYTAKHVLSSAYINTNPLGIAIGNSSYTHPSYGLKGMTMEQWIEEASLTATAPVLTSEMPNLSLFAALSKDVGTQKATKDNAADGDVHYVAVVLNTGNDIQYWENINASSAAKNKLASSSRGEYPVGYTMNTSLYELMPNAVKSAYASMTDNELFIAAPSGFGMVDLSIMKGLNNGDTLLDKYLERSNNMFGSAGLNYVSTYGSLEDTAMLDKMAALSNVNGGFVLTANYKTPTGGVYFSNDKVFVAAREVLRGDVYRTNEQIANDSLEKLVARLSTYSTDKTSAEAYTLLQIEDTASVSTYDKLVKQLYEAADENICFVTPDQLLSLIKANVSPEGTLTQTIGTLNVAPVAQEITMSTTEGKQVKIAYADYVTDENPEDMDALVVGIANRPAHGTARISGGNITYKPEKGFTGTDTFEYTVNDGNELVTAKVTVTVE